MSTPPMGNATAQAPVKQDTSTMRPEYDFQPQAFAPMAGVGAGFGSGYGRMAKPRMHDYSQAPQGAGPSAPGTRGIAGLPNLGGYDRAPGGYGGGMPSPGLPAGGGSVPSFGGFGPGMKPTMYRRPQVPQFTGGVTPQGPAPAMDQWNAPDNRARALALLGGGVPPGG